LITHPSLRLNIVQPSQCTAAVCNCLLLC
jgi:hypothetical protein